MNFKEEYFSRENFSVQISAIKGEIDSLSLRKRDWKVNLSESALVVADMQNYFLSADSHAFIPAARSILPNIKTLIEFFGSNHRPVIFTRHINHPGNAGRMNWWWKDLIEEGSSAALITDELDTRTGEIITKHQYDAFYATDLEDLLRKHNALCPVICGVMANLCCETTVRSAFVKGFQPVMPIDATATYHRDLHIATFKNLAFGFSPAMTTDEVIHSLKA